MPTHFSAALGRIRKIPEFGVTIALLAICLVLALSSRSFLQTSNLLQVMRQASDYGIMAIGMVFVLTLGEVDLSVGSILTLVNISTALALRNGWPVTAALATGIAVGGACGIINGILSVLLRVPTIIITLGTMSIFRAIALGLSKSSPISRFPKNSVLFSVGGGDVFHIPAAVIGMIVVAVIAHVLLQQTAFGWRLQAAGSNPLAARFSGIPIARYKIAVMGLMGIISGIAGISALAFLGSADPNIGLGSELSVIAAAIIGGTSLSGGTGSVPGAVLGALIIAVVRNGAVMLGLPINWGTGVNGAVIIIAVAVGAFIRRD
jgi:ribose transport system permease protein